MTVVLAAVVLALVGGGCAMSGPLSDGDQIRMLMEKDRRLQAELSEAQQKAADLAAAGRTPAPAPAPEDPYRAVAVTIGGLTNVVDRGSGPAKERLRVIVEPIDASGDVVKRAGSLMIEAFEPGPAGQPPKLYNKWTFSPNVLAETWLSGLGEYAYVLRLAWPMAKPPATDMILVRATFTTLDGRVLVTESAVSVKSAAPAPVTAAPPASAK